MNGFIRGVVVCTAMFGLSSGVMAATEQLDAALVSEVRALTKVSTELVRDVLNVQSTLEDVAPELKQNFERIKVLETIAVEAYIDHEMFCRGYLQEGGVQYYYQSGGRIKTEGVDSSRVVNKEELFADPYGVAEAKRTSKLSWLWYDAFIESYGQLYSDMFLETPELFLEDEMILQPNDRESFLRNFVVRPYNSIKKAFEDMEEEGANCNDSSEAAQALRRFFTYMRDNNIALERIDKWVLYLIEQREHEYMASMDKATEFWHDCHGDVPYFRRDNFDPVLAQQVKETLYSGDLDERSRADWGRELTQNALPTQAMKTVVQDIVSGQFPADEAFGLSLMYGWLAKTSHDQDILDSNAETLQADCTPVPYGTAAN